MSSFSPYTYDISQLNSYEGLSNKNIDEYYNVFTMLAKPEQRNVYKLSLGQLIHYMVDFGIGYNSVCKTTVTSLQKFTTGMYVNKHGTKSPLRPATVADLKEKVKDVVIKMVRATVRGVRQSVTTSTDGAKAINTIAPKYLFTLDTDSHLADKLKLLTNHTYTEITDFKDFAYTSNTSFTPQYANGYAPADDFLMCPEHNHSSDENMKKAAKYEIGASLKPMGNTMWSGHAINIKLAEFTKYHYDKAINPLWPVADTISAEPASAEANASWKVPDVVCETSEDVYPDKTIIIGGKKYISLHWPGRRYRLFERTD